MKININYTLDIDEEELRRTLDNYYGEQARTKRQLAADFRSFMESHAESDWQTAVSDAFSS